MKRVISMMMLVMVVQASVAYAAGDKIGPYPAVKVLDGCNNLATYVPAAVSQRTILEMQAMVEQGPSVLTTKYGSYDQTISKSVGGMQFSSQGNYANLMKAAFGVAGKADKRDMVKFFSVLARPLKTINGETNNFSFYSTLAVMAGNVGTPLKDFHLAFAVMEALKLYDFVQAKPDGDVQTLIAAMFSGDAATALKIARADYVEPHMIQNVCNNAF